MHLQENHLNLNSDVYTTVLYVTGISKVYSHQAIHNIVLFQVDNEHT